MRIIDPGHNYDLECYDQGDVSTNQRYCQYLRFMKREGPIYPGNVGHYSGTNIQEVLRVLIDRLKYLDNQIHSHYNTQAIGELRYALAGLEARAAERHGIDFTYPAWEIEKRPTCKICGHIVCRHSEKPCL